MTETFKPQTLEQIADAVAYAVSAEKTLCVRGSGAKDGLGAPVTADLSLDLGGMSGIVMYEPDELVLQAKAGTSMNEILSALAKNNQQLAFEPVDLSHLLGGGAGGNSGGSIGGMVACNVAGPRRVSAGAVRDHVLGFNAVSGRGEVFKSGGRVVKNVTGFDLSKLMTGSFGTLAVMSDVTIKVLPKPEKQRTVLVFGAEAEAGRQAMSDALGSSFEVSSAAYLPPGVAEKSAVGLVRDAHASVTAVRVEGPGPSVASRCASLRNTLKGFGDLEELHTANSEAFWSEVRDCRYFETDETQIWRISTAPTEGPKLASRLRQETVGQTFFDWGGGLVWFEMAPEDDAGHERVRAAVAECGGHATLVRASAEVRARVPIFQPQPPAMQALAVRIKEQFDPKGVLNPGRMSGQV